jgi:hypothetical protein
VSRTEGSIDPSDPIVVNIGVQGSVGRGAHIEGAVEGAVEGGQEAGVEGGREAGVGVSEV